MEEQDTHHVRKQQSPRHPGCSSLCIRWVIHSFSRSTLLISNYKALILKGAVSLKDSWINYATPVSLGKEGKEKGQKPGANINTHDKHNNNGDNHHVHFLLDMHSLIHLILTPVVQAGDSHYLHLVEAETEA